MADRRICRTPEEAFDAGWSDGADDPPLTPEQRTKIAAMLAPSVRPQVRSGDRPPVTCACGVSNHPSRRRCQACREQLPVSEAERARREAIARIVDAAPPLTAQQTAMLRKIFTSTHTERTPPCPS